MRERALVTALRRLGVLAALGGALSMPVACGVAIGPAYDEDYPPDAYIATTEPYYYDGRPTYWYGGHWYYRDGGHWAHYDREPAGLYQRRIAGPPVRQHYESWRGRPAPAPAGNWRGAPARGGGTWRGKR
ncbi:MAG TPA: hypothetical protein VHJ20_00850 [Polyangia bacterium]|nr:hypothetical protein [Polyangia bacterium]